MSEARLPRDRLRDRLLGVLERRAAQHDDAVQDVLRRRMAALIERYDDAPAGAPAAVADGSVAPPGPLRALVERLDAHAATRGRAGVALDGAAQPTSAPEPEALRSLRRTWSTLRAEQRLSHSLAKLPANAGPLNSQQLVHRALTLMREQSPAYLNCFVGYVDALLWLDGLNESPGSAAARATSASAARGGAAEREAPGG